jgi:TolB-like protein
MLAVLPFENLSGDPAQEYFSDGLSEETIVRLGQMSPGRMGVIARTSSMAYKQTHKPGAQIGLELGVDYVLEGSVRREADRVRITAQLIRVQDQIHLWAETYDRRLRGVLDTHSEIGATIAAQVRLKLILTRQQKEPRGRPFNWIPIRRKLTLLTQPSSFGFDRDFKGAEAAARRAIQLNENSLICISRMCFRILDNMTRHWQ